MTAKKHLHLKGIILLAAIGLALYLATPTAAAGQVMITELVAATGSGVIDEDGDSPDWIELYNGSGATINLAGWYLTDDAAELTKWQFPAISLAPNDYLVVFASDKNRALPGSELHTNFKLNDAGEYVALVRPDGVSVAWEYAPTYPEQFSGMSYGLDGTQTERYYNVPTPGAENESTAANRTPLITDVTYTPNPPTETDAIALTATVIPSAEPVGSVHLRYRESGFGFFSNLQMFDDGAHGDGAAGDGVYGVVFPAGTFQTNDLIEYYILAENALGYAARWPQFEPDLGSLFIVPAGYTPPTLYINEIMASTASAYIGAEAYDFNDWIEIYNPGPAAVDIGGFYLTNDLGNPTQWHVPVGTTVPAGGFAIFWADEEDSDNRTNFSLRKEGGDIALFDYAGTLIDALSYDAQTTNISYGRETDGSTQLHYFGDPTPAATNDTAEAFVDTSAIAPAPEFSVAAGFYATPQTVALSTSLAGAEIWYTTDGSIPVQGGASATLYTGTPVSINATTVLRARTFKSGHIPSGPASSTYFINESATLPIVSIAINPEYLTDDVIGIFVAGSNGTSKSACENVQPRNYYQNWERPIAFELYEPDGAQVINMDAGLKVFGNCSRRFNPKSVSIRAREKYGDDTLSYPFFDDREAEEYPVILLRNSGHDYNRTLMRDGAMQRILVGQMDIDYQAYRPAVVYINGQYYGILNMREKMTEEYVEVNHGYEEDEIEMIDRFRDGKNTPELVPRVGDMTAYDNLVSYMKNNDMADPAVYDTVAQQIDIDEHINYFIAQIYFATTDWPSNNVRMWRPLDGRWRWMLYDLDSGFDSNKINVNNLNRAVNSSPEWSSIVMRRLMENQTYREEFAQRFAAHLNITFDPARVLGIIDDAATTLAPEIPKHRAKWGFPSNWNNQVDRMRTFANQRPAVQFAQLISFDNTDRVSATAELAIVTTPAEGGSVYVHDVLVPGASFTGDFFTTIPIRLAAEAKPGYRFVRWEQAGLPDVTDRETTIAINGAHTITAVFEPYTPPNVVINEIHYNPADSQGTDDDFEFIELYNAEGVSVDLSGFTFTDGIAFTFPAGATLAPDEYILIAKNAATYLNPDYQVFQWESGRLANSGEALELQDAQGFVVDYVPYDDGNVNGVPDPDSDWVIPPDGQLPSLELINPALDNALAVSWEASVIAGGTPGRSNSDDTLAVTLQRFESTAAGRPNYVVIAAGMLLVFATAGLWACRQLLLSEWQKA